ncbi:MAG: helix-turn-helix transcriptional regulator [Lachnospiraceae bacterium]|nr:helix-turn-helix transcriptional regulator [Lachnospiraceae bacterium]
MEEFPCEAYYHRIGRNIRRLRRKKGMTQEALAEEAGLSIKMIQKLENGQKGFHMETIIKIAVTLDVSLDSLTGMRGADKKLMFWQEAFYAMTEDKTDDEIKYAVGIVDSVFKLHKQYLG